MIEVLLNPWSMYLSQRPQQRETAAEVPQGWWRARNRGEKRQYEGTAETKLRHNFFTDCT